MFGCVRCKLSIYLYLSYFKRFSVLIGPINHIKHLFSRERLPFTAAYFGSLGATLYFAVGVKSYIGSLVFAIVQVSNELR